MKNAAESFTVALTLTLGVVRKCNSTWKSWSQLEIPIRFQLTPGNLALLHFRTPPRVRATVKLSAAFFNDESSIGGYESAIAPEIPHVFVHLFFI